MSKESVTQILERASEDARFREQLANNPESALAGYDLTQEERAALMNGDAKELQDLGVDSRVSKWAGDAGSFGDNGPWS